MLYHVSRNGQNYGPYTLEDLQRYVASRQCAAHRPRQERRDARLGSGVAGAGRLHAGRARAASPSMRGAHAGVSRRGRASIPTRPTCTGRWCC